MRTQAKAVIIPGFKKKIKIFLMNNRQTNKPCDLREVLWGLIRAAISVKHQELSVIFLSQSCL